MRFATVKLDLYPIGLARQYTYFYTLKERAARLVSLENEGNFVTQTGGLL